jgi:hypothetical protein
MESHQDKIEIWFIPNYFMLYEKYLYKGFKNDDFMDTIPNSQLIDSDIPSRRSSWKKIEPFAFTFNGYDHWGSFKKCREIAQLGVANYRNHLNFDQSLTDLRTCLFFEARRWKHFEKKPSKNGMEYIHLILDAIRARVHTKNYS